MADGEAVHAAISDRGRHDRQCQPRRRGLLLLRRLTVGVDMFVRVSVMRTGVGPSAGSRQLRVEPRFLGVTGPYGNGVVRAFVCHDWSPVTG